MTKGNFKLTNYVRVILGASANNAVRSIHKFTGSTKPGSDYLVKLMNGVHERPGIDLAWVIERWSDGHIVMQDWMVEHQISTDRKHAKAKK